MTKQSEYTPEEELLASIDDQLKIRKRLAIAYDVVVMLGLILLHAKYGSAAEGPLEFGMIISMGLVWIPWMICVDRYGATEKAMYMAKIAGDENQSVDAEGDWTNTGTTTIGGESYSIYQSDSNGAQVAVDQQVGFA